MRLARELIGAAAAAGGGGMSTERPGQGLGRGLSALLGEARCARRRRRPSRIARRRARDRDRAGSGPIPTSRASSSTRRRSTSWPNSIAERGVLQPILLRPDGDGFEIIAGERRWRAAQRARLHAIPAIVREIDECDDRRDRADREYPARGSERDRGGGGLSAADRAARPYPGRGRPSSSTSRAATSPTC